VSSAGERERRRLERMTGRIRKIDGEAALRIPDAARRSIQLRIELSAELLKSAESRLERGALKEARAALEQSVNELNEASETAAYLLPEVDTLRMMAGIGLQMNAFVHEIKAVHQAAVAIAETIEEYLEEHRDLAPATRRFIKQLMAKVQQLTRSLERHAAYLAEVLSADARRRRSKQRIGQRVVGALEVFTPSIEKLGVEVTSSVDESLLTPPMFAAELSIVLTNLLSNALKAAGKRGRVRVSASESDDFVEIRMENSGVAVDLKDGEKWFKPFESSVESPDPLLGQGMGLGLPITRDVVESYGGEVKFVSPSKRFETAVVVRLPKGR
jgi:signal transduction histidine kinase